MTDNPGATMFEAVSHDVRYAWRSLRRTPVFTIFAVLILSGGIGATTALFSVLDQVVFRSLPYMNPERLVVVHEILPASATPRSPVNAAHFEEWRAATRSFDGARSLQLAESHDKAPHPRDRHTNCAWREAGRDPPDGARAGPHARRDRYGRRFRRGAGHRTSVPGTAVRHLTERPTRVRAHGDRDRDRVHLRRLLAGAPRLAGESDRCHALGMRAERSRTLIAGC